MGNDRDGLLRGMRMGIPSVYIQLTVHMLAKLRLRQHTGDRIFHQPIGLVAR